MLTKADLESFFPDDREQSVEIAGLKAALAKAEAELEAVMLSVDKWFDVVPETNPATRACDAREIALKALARAEAERDALERAIGEWIDVRARIGVPATFADKNLRDALHSLRASRRAPNHHPARPECRVYGYDHTFGPDAADQMAPHIIALRARAERVEAEIASAHQALTRAGVEEQIPPLKTALAPLVGRILRLGYRAEKAEAELAALRDLTRVRDARVEKPKPGDLVLLWDGYSWEADRLEAGLGFWRDSGREVDSYPYWLPPPPKPEETR